MNRSALANFRRLPLHVAIGLALAACAIGSAQATTRTFTGASGGLWSATSSWAGGLGPVNGDDAVVGSSGASSRTATFASVMTGAGLNLLNLDYGSTINQSLTGSAMIAVTETIGSTQAQTSTYNQSGGSNTTGRLYVGYQGVGSGVYNLSGGALNVGTAAVAGDVDIGWNTGTTGAFNQSAGATTVLGQFRAGYNDPSTSGTVTLKGGSFSVRDQVTIGVFGTGSFTQSGGSATLGGLVLGYQLDSRGKGSYILNSNDGAASLNSGGYVDIGVGGGSSSFTQSGNTTHQVAGRLRVGKAGSYTLDGGTLSAGKLIIEAGGVITQTGGTLNLVNSADSSKAGSFVWTGGQLHFSGDASFADASLLARNTTLTSSMSLRVDGMLTQSDSSVLNLAGGQLQVGNATLSGQVTVGQGSTLSTSTRLSNVGSLQLAGGNLSGAGLLFNVTELNGHGRIAGTGGFVNSGLLMQSGGDLVLNNTGANENRGGWNLLAGRQLELGENAQLDNAGQLNLNGGAVVGSGVLLNTSLGTISGNGSIASGFVNFGSLVVDKGQTRIDQSFVNKGQILLGANSATLAGAQIGNHGLIQGLGRINNDISNIDPIAVIEAQGGTLTLAGRIVSPNSGLLSVVSGAKLLILQGLASNAGKIQLAGGTLDNNGFALSNEVTGTLSGYGTLRGGLLTNKGQIQLSGGAASPTSIYANLLASAGSKTIVSGSSNATFYGNVDVQSGAELRVSTGSVVTFFGDVQQRTGSKFTGAGSKRFEGTLTVGASPGLGTDEGDVEFGESSSYLAEIGGISACTLRCGSDEAFKNNSFDKYIVAGNLSLNGTLKLTSWNGFVAQKGQSFDLLDWGTLTGTFADIDASGFKLAAGTQLDFSQLYTNGSISVTVAAVPEPASLALWLAGLGALGSVVRRRRLASKAG
ncbi:PEP-CTERM sorting domain-containing protein [Paucibacter sp. TC2R-5]|uniref:PEP-CTERM sorting domain-containing protein n=1 Tax=Paucibacter sp. TC2R-5 TaxID=2893555 RepID=UPI0021E3AE0E|nr:PEP-CTERM sorting domain-containing protein [Paucibacter sp. TC2R-5]MCV2361301.1 PEP-CTERM sorting domain-containing protein [Paucibacter sp. TC2R-5]